MGKYPETTCKLCGSKVKLGYRMIHLMKNHEDTLIAWEEQWKMNHNFLEFIKKIKRKNSFVNKLFKHKYHKGKVVET